MVSAKEPLRRNESEELAFEEALQRLDGVVASLERGELGLEEAIKRYEEGVALVRTCLARLQQAEERVNRLVLRQGEQGLVLEPLSAVAEGTQGG